MKPIEEQRPQTVEWIKSGAMQSANYAQLQEAYSICFDKFNLRLNKTQLRSSLQNFANSYLGESGNHQIKI